MAIGVAQTYFEGYVVVLGVRAGRSGHRGESADASPQCLKPRTSTTRSSAPRSQKTVMSRSSQRVIFEGLCVRT